MRFTSFDIEATGLRSTYNRLLCCCFHTVGENEVTEVTAPRYKDEPEALDAIWHEYNKADVVMGWNSKLYDVPFINGRLMMRRKDIKVPARLPEKKHLDLMYMARKLKMTSSRMDHVAQNFEMDHQKYNVISEAWVKAADGDGESLEQIVEHCNLDVQMTSELFDLLKDYVIRITK